MNAYRKCVAAIADALAVAASLIADGSLSASDVIAIMSAAVGALAVYAVPNHST